MVENTAGARIEKDSTDLELLAAEDVIDIDEQAETSPDTASVSYFGTDFDVHGLVRRLNSGDVLVPSFDPEPNADVAVAGFQRRFVWRRYQMDRFVESLLLGYPVPGIFLVQQPNKKLLVLDGQQRLRTLQSFYRGIIDKDTVFTLEQVSPPFEGLLYDELSDEDRRTLDDTFIHATVIRFDGSKEGAESIYKLFERLNTGGTNLYPQEIRVALYNGQLVTLLRKFNTIESWRNLYGNASERLKDQELILRFIALYVNSESYERPLKSFLNGFLGDHRDLQDLDVETLTERFVEVCNLLWTNVGRSAFRATGQVNAALVDSVMVGLARRLDAGDFTAPDQLPQAIAALLKEDSFQAAIARATADEERVARRLRMATEAFLRLP